MKDQEQESLYKDDWWLEHLEEELEPNLREDLELLLMSSKEDRRVFESLERTRRLVKESDDVALPESGLYYQDLHDRIMSAIDEEQPLPRVSVGARKSRVSWPAIFGTVSMSAILGFVTWFSAGTGPIQVAQMEKAGDRLERFIASASPVTPAAFSDSVLSYQSEADVVADALASKLKHMSRAEFDQMLQKLRK